MHLENARLQGQETVRTQKKRVCNAKRWDNCPLRREQGEASLPSFPSPRAGRGRGEVGSGWKTLQSSGGVRVAFRKPLNPVAIFRPWRRPSSILTSRTQRRRSFRSSNA
jgi:hypothetical protein